MSKRSLEEEGQDMVQVGQVYKEDNGLQEVIPYHVDFATAIVSFAPVGRSSEDKMRTSDFLNRFTLLGPVSSMAEKQLDRAKNPPKEENNSLSLVEINKAVREARAGEKSVEQANQPQSTLAHPKAK